MTLDASAVEVFRKAREKYRPERVRLLWVAESPPTSGSFFYFDEATGHDHLFRETMKAVGLWPDDVALRKGTDKRPLLERFQSEGHYLVDTSPYPVDKFPDNKRRAALEDGLHELGRLVAQLDPNHIIIVKSNVYPLTRAVLVSLGMNGRVLNNKPLPFPTHGRQQSYRTEVRGLLSRTGML